MPGWSSVTRAPAFTSSERALSAPSSSPARHPSASPIVRGLMIGHVEDKATVPLGIQAELDADAGTLTLLEPAVT